ncbi:MAG: DUF4150 domain-containing protein [Rhodobacteraceae bacterium]|nr:DUF4150 domain-containing protein [Paracoccaceae bacterium]
MTDVYANGREVSGKATPNKTIAAFPDVCLSPPSPPAGPIPIPYPNFGMASDTTDSCTTVFVKGKEAGKKNASKYAKITGDEAATNSFGASVLSHKINGPLYFAAYSFDVMFEGGGADRFGDITTTNHMNTPTTMAPTPSLAKPDPPRPPSRDDCKAMKAKNAEFREKHGRKIIKKRKGSGTGVQFNTAGTVSQGQITTTGGGPSFAGVSATKQLKKAGVPGLSQPVNSNRKKKPRGKFKGKKKVKMDFCGGECAHEVGLHAHAELNILNDIGRKFATTKKTNVLLAIDWNGREGKGSPNPCTNCKKMIACACQCMTIYICDAKGNPKNACESPAKK